MQKFKLPSFLCVYFPRNQTFQFLKVLFILSESIPCNAVFSALPTPTQIGRSWFYILNNSGEYTSTNTLIALISFFLAVVLILKIFSASLSPLNLVFSVWILKSSFKWLFCRLGVKVLDILQVVRLLYTGSYLTWVKAVYASVPFPLLFFWFNGGWQTDFSALLPPLDGQIAGFQMA